MFKNKRIISLFLMMLMVVGMATSVYASKSDVAKEIEPRAILCQKCYQGYMVDGEETDDNSYSRSGSHERMDGYRCSYSYSHREYVTYVTRYSKCAYCGYGVEYGTKITSVCR